MPSSEPKPIHQIHEDEHDDDSPFAKRVLTYGWDPNALTKRRIKVNADGELVIGESGGVSDDFEGGPVEVGTTAVELTFTGTTNSIQIQADHDNTGTIWFGKGDITDAGVNAFGRLEAGEAVQFDLDDASIPIYAVSDTAAQKVYKLALI